MGGAISILLNAFIIWYLITLSIKMIWYQDDKITTSVSQKKFSDFGNNGVLEMENKDLLIYFQLIDINQFIGIDF